VLIEEVVRCETRADLERLLGPPKYALAGHGFSSQTESPDQVGRYVVESPDQVESYVKDDCRVEIWFRQGRLWLVCGSEDYSPWLRAE
jgi:hypothetical protein